MTQSAVARLRDAGFAPLSAAQQAMWLADQSVPGRPAYHICRVLHLRGALDVAALEGAIGDVLATHEALRATIPAADGQPVQRVLPELAPDLSIMDVVDARAAALAEAARPFDLARGPLIRTTLLRISPEHHQLVLTVHHLVADGWSIAVLLGDLTRAYRARVGGTSVARREVPGYRSYVDAERAFAASAACAQRIEQWRSRLDGVGPLEVPTDRLRQEVPRRPGAVHRFAIPAEVADRLRSGPLTPSLLAAFGVLLHRYTGEDDLVVAVPTANRLDSRWASTIGLLVNTVPVRFALAGNPHFADVTKDVAAVLLCELQACAPPAGSVPLPPGGYRVAFGVVHDLDSTLDLPGLSTTVERIYTGHAKFELNLEIIDQGPGRDLDARLEYDTELFDETTVTTLSGCYLRYLSGVDGQARIGSVPLVEQVGPARVRPATDPRVDTLFLDLAARIPDQVALLGPGCATVTYGELAGRVELMAGALVASGVRAGDHVGLAIPRSVELVVAMLAVLRAGAAYVPIDPDYPAPRIASMITDAGVRLVITDADLDAPTLSLAELEKRAGSVSPAPQSGYAAACVLFTSGSTGRPKAVVLSHRGTVRLAAGVPGGELRWLHMATPSFDATTIEVFTPLLSGGSVVVVAEQPTVARLGAIIAEFGVESAFFTTGLFNVIADSDAEILRPMRQVLTGGELMSPPHAQRVLRLGPTVIDGYGPTENTGFSTLHVVEPDPDHRRQSIGISLPASSVHIVDRYFAAVPPGVVGEILVGGDGVAWGYQGAAAATALQFVPDPWGGKGSRLYRTGDRGWLDRAGRLHFAGRRDDQVKVRGFRVEPGEIERAAQGHPEVDRVAVVARPGPNGDKRLVGFYVGTAGTEGLSAYLAGRLPAFMLPAQWVRLPELPLGTTGKVDRSALRVPDGPDVVPDPPAGSAIEQQLVAWFAELLGRSDVNRDTDFILDGGHSLVAARLAARINQTLGVDLPLGLVLRHSRLGSLAGVIADARRADTPTLVASGRTHHLPLSPAQARMWFLHRLEPHSPAYHVPIAMRITGPLDRAALGAALDALLAKHPMLRTVFGETDGTPWQTILPVVAASVPLSDVDLTELPDEICAAALEQVIATRSRIPFDLTGSIPVRATVVRMSAESHVLLLVVHHIAADGWSMPLLCQDLAAAYSSTPQPATGPTYADFAAWQRDLLAGPEGTRLEEFWRSTLDGLAAGKPGSGDRGALHRFELPPDLVAAARELSNRHGVTLFATLLTAFATLLRRRSGQDDVVVGTPVANRTRPEVADLVGLFVNTVPIRCGVDVVDTSRAIMDALDHAELPYERIIEVAAGGRVRVLFALQPEIESTFPIGDCVAELIPVHHGTAKFDLTMSLFDSGGTVRGFLEYRTNVYNAGDARDLVEEFEEVLAELAGELPDLLRGVGAVWSEVLGIADPRRGTDFFGSGGDSLSALRVVARIRDRFGRDVALTELFDHPRLGEFASRVAQAPDAGTRPALRPSGLTGPAPLSPAQERHWILHEIDPDDTGNNVPIVVRLRGELDRAALDRALTMVALRQEILRTTFERDAGGMPVAVVHRPMAITADHLESSGDLDAVLTGLAEVRFSLTDSPPWRVTLVRTGENDHHLVINLHHILTDGWSTAVLLAELSATYAGHAELPALTVQYADYARWQRDTIEQSTADFWRTRLAGLPDLDLPTDRPRTARAGHRGATVPIVLTPAQHAGLRRVAAESRGTLFSAVLTVFAELLGRYSGQSDFAVGTFHANRDEPATEHLIGFFVNNVPLRCRLDTSASWRDRLEVAGREVASAFSRANFPFERMIDVPRSAFRTPVFQAMCVLQNLPAWPESMGELRVEQVRRPYDRADFDLTLWLAERPGGELSGGLAYDADLFDESTVDALATGLITLIDACIAEPQAPARKTMVGVRPPAALSAPGSGWLPERFAASAQKYADNVAVAGDVTYRELAGTVNRLANRLIALGVRAESRVAVVMPRSAELMASLLAVLASGGAYVPIDPGYPTERIATLIRESGATLVLTVASLLSELPVEAIAIDDGHTDEYPDVLAPVEIHGEQLAYLIFTSGSTGRPKAVLVSHANLINYLDGITGALGLTHEDRVLNFASISFDATTEEIYPALLTGASVLPRPSELRVPDAAFDALLATFRPTVLSLPVSFWHAWVDQLGAGFPDSVRAVWLNAEEPGMEAYHRWLAVAGDRVRLLNTYGPTEGTVTASLYDPATDGPAPEVWQRFPIGVELPTVSLRVLDQAGHPVPDGAVGELCLGGPSVTRGYAGMPGRTADAYRPDPTVPGGRLYRTGDLARRLTGGALLLLGRTDRQVKIRGFRVDPGEVDAMLATHPDIGQVATLAHNKQLISYVAGRGDPVAEADLRAYLAVRVPDYLVPARILCLPALPLGDNGKIDRRALLARLARDLAVMPAGAVPPRTPVERRLHEIWAGVLGGGEFGVHDSFFAVGGDSIMGLQVASRARDAGLAITVRQLFEHQTIAELAGLAATVPNGGPEANGPVTGLSSRQLRDAMTRLGGG